MIKYWACTQYNGIIPLMVEKGEFPFFLVDARPDDGEDWVDVALGIDEEGNILRKDVELYDWMKIFDDESEAKHFQNGVEWVRGLIKDKI